MVRTALKLVTYGQLLQLKQPMGNCRSCQWVAICAQASHGWNQCLPTGCPWFYTRAAYQRFCRIIDQSFDHLEKCGLCHFSSSDHHGKSLYTCTCAWQWKLVLFAHHHIKSNGLTDPFETYSSKTHQRTSDNFFTFLRKIGTKIGKCRIAANFSGLQFSTAPSLFPIGISPNGIRVFFSASPRKGDPGSDARWWSVTFRTEAGEDRQRQIHGHLELRLRTRHIQWVNAVKLAGS